jgi:hypothetical protein
VRAGRQRALFVELLPLETRRGEIQAELRGIYETYETDRRNPPLSRDDGYGGQSARASGAACVRHGSRRGLPGGVCEKGAFYSPDVLAGTSCNNVGCITVSRSGNARS